MKNTGFSLIEVLICLFLLSILILGFYAAEIYSLRQNQKAIDEASRYGAVNIATKLEEHNGYMRIPPQNKWQLDSEATYLHFTPNETIEGVEFHWTPQTGSVPLVADMTSLILSKPIDVKDYGIIYAGAQKNLGLVGITVVIIRDELVYEPLSGTPTLYQYKTQAEHKSFYNTPPTYSWYMVGLVLAWMKRQGGIKTFAEINQRKAKKLYTLIDEHKEFYFNPVHPDSRSIMNVPFNLPNDELTQMFLDTASQAGLKYLKGHRLAGGVRASLYNAMPEAGVDALVDFMKDFMNRYG